MPLLSPDPLGLHPYIIPPTEGDLKEARIKQALDLAHLRILNAQPENDRLSLALQKAGLDETTAYHASQAALDRRGQDVTQRGQDIQQRGQDLTAAADAAQNSTAIRGQDLHQQEAKGNQFSSIVDSFVRAGGSYEDLATAAASAGHPELLAAVKAHKSQDTEKKAGLYLGTYLAAKPSARPALLQQIQANDPEVHDAVMKHLSTLADNNTLDAVAGPTQPFATRFGSFIRQANVRANKVNDTLLHGPENAGATFSNFLDGLLDRKKKTQP